MKYSSIFDQCSSYSVEDIPLDGKNNSNYHDISTANNNSMKNNSSENAKKNVRQMYGDNIDGDDLSAVPFLPVKYKPEERKYDKLCFTSSSNVSFFDNGNAARRFESQLTERTPSCVRLQNDSLKSSGRSGVEPEKYNTPYSPTAVDGEKHRRKRRDADVGDLTPDDDVLDESFSGTGTRKKYCSALVVDDSALNRLMMIRLLKARFDYCDEAIDGQDAIDKFQMCMDMRKSYDLILLDSSMPIMDGPTAARQIRSLGYSGLMIGVTGNVLPEDINHFKIHGVDEVLMKPLNMKALDDILA